MDVLWMVIIIIYKTEEKGKQKIFGTDFVKNNKNILELIINDTKNEIIDEYDLKNGVNNIEINIIKNLTNLEKMFYEACSLKGIEELKYLNT